MSKSNQVFAIGKSLSCRTTSLRKALRIMKITVVLLTVVCLHAYAGGYTQGITISVKKASLETVFKKIKEQTGYGFIYRKEHLADAKKVNIDVTNAPLKEVLELCFRDQPVTYSIIDNMIVVSERVVVNTPSVVSPQPPIEVRGRVTNERGEPVEGVSVTIKGTTIATSTDGNGEFLLKSVDPEAVLVFTGVNIETFEHKVSGKTELAVSLKTKISSLGDVAVVVNTGYERIPKERSTGSFEFVSNEELNRRVGADILSRLESVANSVYIDRRSASPGKTGISADDINIRGVSTLTDWIKQPLVVVNNVIYDGDINSINPNDIESITILKDAAAASIWGARAGNGVIVLTTRHGRLHQSPTISVNMNASIIDEPDLFHYPQMTSSDYIDVETFLFGQGHYDGDLSDQTYWPVMTPVVEILEQERNGLLSPAEAAAQINALRLSDVRHDFKKYVYQKGINQQYALNISGGSEKHRYFISGGFDKGRSMLIGDENRRVTFRANNDLALAKFLDLSLSVAYGTIHTQNNSLGEIGSYGIGSGFFPRDLYPYARFADDAGNPLVVPHHYRTGFIDTAGGGLLLDWKYRPLQELKNTDRTSNMQDIVLSFAPRIKLSRHLSLEGNYQLQRTRTDSRNYMSMEMFSTRDMINRYSEFNGTDMIRHVPLGGILSESFQDLQSQTGRAQLSFNHTWSEKHQVAAIAGGEIREMLLKEGGDQVYGYDPANQSISNVDYLTNYDHYVAAGYGPVPHLKSFGQKTDHFVSWYGNASYTFDQRYTVSGSFRKDYSNLFGASVNDRSQPFWTAGGAWTLSREKFFKVKAIDYLKLRATYGYQGNVNNTLAPYALLDLIPALYHPFNLVSGYISVPANPGLSWEKVGQFNAGLDFRVLQNRIGGSIEYYRKNATDLILRAFVDPTTGLPSVLKNSANMTGRGWDIVLTSRNIVSRGFNWETEFSFSAVKNEVTKYLLRDENRGIRGFMGNALNMGPVVGTSPYSIYSYPFAGLDPATGDPLGYLGKNVSNDWQGILGQSIDTGNFIYHGSGIPTIFGFLNNNFQFKGVFLKVSINYSLNYYFRKNTISYFDLYTKGVQHADFSGRWQNPGDEARTHIPSMVYPLTDSWRDEFYAASSVNVLKADHIRLSNIQLGYQLPASLVNKIKIKRAEFYANLSNLGILWRANKEGLDPAYNAGNALYPPLKILSLGLRADF